MKFLLSLAIVFSLLAATFAAAATAPEMDAGSGCVTLENGAFCVDPAAAPAKSGATEKSSKCLGPYLAAGDTVLCLSGGHAHAIAFATTDDGLPPRHPKRPPRI